MDIFSDPLKKSGIEHTDFFGISAEKAGNREVVDYQDVNKFFNDSTKLLGPSEEEAKTMKKINLYKDMNELGTDGTKFGALFATIRIKEDVILFTSSTGENVSAYGVRKYYQEYIYNRTEPKSVVYYEDIYNNGSTYANYVEIIGHTSGWDVEILMIQVCLNQNTQYMILVY